jgi:hypothetical protein
VYGPHQLDPRPINPDSFTRTQNMVSEGAPGNNSQQTYQDVVNQLTVYTPGTVEQGVIQYVITRFQTDVVGELSDYDLFLPGNESLLMEALTAATLVHAEAPLSDAGEDSDFEEMHDLLEAAQEREGRAEHVEEVVRRGQISGVMLQMVQDHGLMHILDNFNASKRRKIDSKQCKTDLYTALSAHWPDVWGGVQQLEDNGFFEAADNMVSGPDDNFVLCAGLRVDTNQPCKAIIFANAEAEFLMVDGVATTEKTRKSSRCVCFYTKAPCVGCLEIDTSDLVLAQLQDKFFCVDMCLVTLPDSQTLVHHVARSMQYPESRSVLADLAERHAGGVFPVNNFQELLRDGLRPLAGVDAGLVTDTRAEQLRQLIPITFLAICREDSYTKLFGDAEVCDRIFFVVYYVVPLADSCGQHPDHRAISQSYEWGYVHVREDDEHEWIEFGPGLEGTPSGKMCSGCVDCYAAHPMAEGSEAVRFNALAAFIQESYATAMAEVPEPTYKPFAAVLKPAFKPGMPLHGFLHNGWPFVNMARLSTTNTFPRPGTSGRVNDQLEEVFSDDDDDKPVPFDPNECMEEDDGPGVEEEHDAPLLGDDTGDETGEDMD